MMTVWVLSGLVLGVVCAHYANAGKRNFRARLLKDLKLQRDTRSLEAYLSGIISHEDRWKRSMSLIRKPFRKQVNLAVETLATLMALLGIVNGVSNFHQIFQSATQGGIVITFLATVLAFIPSQGFISAQIEKDMDAVLQEMKRAVDRREVDAFLSRAISSWPE